MDYKRILTIQDISCVGQCSLTVALPIISACGVEAGVLPSAVLSTHTGGFSGYTFRNLADDIPAICNHWEKEKIKFDAVYTGYLGSVEQIDYVIDIMNRLGNEKCLNIVDPAMADNGRMYTGFGEDYAEAMKKLCSIADIVLPNITEASYLTGIEYKEKYNIEYVESLCKALVELGAKKPVITGVSYKDDTTGVVVYENGKMSYYEHKKISKGYHGTGDIYSSAFVGALMNGKTAYDASKIAADYTLMCIENTINDQTHWYGVKFEPMLGKLIEMI